MVAVKKKWRRGARNNVHPGSVAALMALRKKLTPEKSLQEADRFIEYILAMEFRHSKLKDWEILQILDETKTKAQFVWVQYLMERADMTRNPNEICQYIITSIRGAARNVISAFYRERFITKLQDQREKQERRSYVDNRCLDRWIENEDRPLIEAAIDAAVDEYMAVMGRAKMALPVIHSIFTHRIWSAYHRTGHIIQDIDELLREPREWAVIKFLQ